MASTTTAETTPTEADAAELIATALHAGAPPRKAIRPSRGIVLAVMFGVISWLVFGLLVWAAVGHLALLRL